MVIAEEEAVLIRSGEVAIAIERPVISVIQGVGMFYFKTFTFIIIMIYENISSVNK